MSVVSFILHKAALALKYTRVSRWANPGKPRPPSLFLVHRKPVDVLAGRCRIFLKICLNSMSMEMYVQDGESSASM